MKAKLLTILFGGITVCMAVAVVFWTIIPAHQARVASRVFHEIRIEPREAVIPSNIFTPYTYVQPEIRNAYLDLVFSLYKDNIKDVALTLLPDAKARMQEVVNQGNMYPRYILSLAKAYNLSADAQGDNASYEKADMYYAQALRVVPRSPAITYAYGISLIDQGRADEGIRVLKDLLEANERIPESHYYLALGYIKTGPTYYDQAFDELEKTFLLKPDLKIVGTKALYAQLFQHYYSTKNKERFMLVARRLSVLDPEQEGMYIKIMQYVARHNALPVINISQ